MNKARWNALGRLALSLGLLFLLFQKQGVNLGSIAATLRQAKLVPLWGAIAVYCGLGSLIRGYRWRSLIRSLGHSVSLGRATELFLIGTFFNQIMPTAIGGDVVRAEMLARDGVGRAHAASTVLVDRALGILTLLIPGLLALVVFPGRATPVVTGLLLVAGLGGLAAGAFLIRGKAWRPHASRLPVLGRVFAHPSIGRFVDSFGDYGYPALAAAAGWSVLFTATLIVANMWMGQSLSIAQATLADWLIMVPLISIAMLLPSIGGWGIREWSYVGFLGLLDPPVAIEKAAAMGLLLGLMNSLTALVGGLLTLRNAVGRRSAPPVSLAHEPGPDA